MFRQSTSQDLRLQILFVAQPVCATLNDPGLVVVSFDKAKRDLVLGLAVGSDSISVPVDHLGELLIRLQPLPLQLPRRVLEELPWSCLAPVAPDLSEGLLQYIGGVEPIVRRQQELQVSPCSAAKVAHVRRQGVLLRLDELAMLAAESAKFLLSDLAEVANDVKFVVKDRRLGRMLAGRIVEGRTHIHHCQADLSSLLFSEKSMEVVHAHILAVLPTKPDRSRPLQIADHHAIVVPLVHRDLVDRDDPRVRLAGALELLAHVLLVELLDRIPPQPQFLGYVLDRFAGTASAYVAGKAARGGCALEEKPQPLPLHCMARTAIDAADFRIQPDPILTVLQIPHSSARPVVETPVLCSGRPTDRFCPRRSSVPIRAQASSNIPCTKGRGRKPGKAYASTRRCRLRCLAIQRSCQIFRSNQDQKSL